MNAKVGSTSWRTIIIRGKGRPDSEAVRWGDHTVKQKSKIEKLFKNERVLSFYVVRDPYERIASVFNLATIEQPHWGAYKQFNKKTNLEYFLRKHVIPNFKKKPSKMDVHL